MKRAGTLLAGAALALAGCAPAASSPAPPPRPTVVSLNPCADAILTQVAEPGQILAISHYSHDPRSSSMDLDVASRYRATGGTVEEVLALKPDMVVATFFLPPATRAAFQRLGIRVVALETEHDAAQSLAQLRRLSAAVGQSERGERLAVEIKQALADAAPPFGHKPIATVVWQSGGIVPGRNALVSDLLARTGFASHSASRGMKQADYLPLEGMLADPPQLILAAGSPGDGEDRMLSHPALDALAETRREQFDPSLLYCGGPTIIRAVQRLAEVRRGLAS